MSGWPQTQCVAKDDLEFPIPLFLQSVEITGVPLTGTPLIQSRALALVCFLYQLKY